MKYYHQYISAEENSMIAVSLSHAMRNSYFWRKKFKNIGLSEQNIRENNIISKLPFLSKKEILDDQLSNGGFGKLLAVSEKDIQRVHKTSGTSAKPFLIALTKEDIHNTIIASRRAFKEAGLKDGEKVVHCLNFNMWSGGVTDYLALEESGATSIPFGVGSTSNLINLILNLKISSISCTPSYMVTIAEKCQKEFKLDPKKLGLKKGYFGGEPALQLPGFRKKIENLFGISAIDANYGLSEVSSIIAGENEAKNGLNYHCYGILFAELIDNNCQTLEFKKGASGELVLTSLKRQAQPLFRYRTNDLIKIKEVNQGDDGFRRFKFSIIGRSDEMLVVKGVNFFPQSIGAFLNLKRSTVPLRYFVQKPNINYPLEIQVFVIDAAWSKEQKNKTEAKIAEQLQVKVNLNFLSPDKAPNSNENKYKYLIERLP